MERDDNKGSNFTFLVAVLRPAETIMFMRCKVKTSSISSTTVNHEPLETVNTVPKMIKFILLSLLPSGICLTADHKRSDETIHLVIFPIDYVHTSFN